jgi:hypothetical protein
MLVHINLSAVVFVGSPTPDSKVLVPFYHAN